LSHTLTFTNIFLFTSTNAHVHLSVKSLEAMDLQNPVVQNLRVQICSYYQ